MNKKLKKKRVPECNDAYKEALVQKVLDAEVVYEWRNTLQLKLKFRLFIIIPILIGFFGCAFLTRTTPEISIMLVILGILLGSFINFIAYAKRDYLCQVTPYGIRNYETEQVPEVFYKATRILAYVGIVVCVIAVIFIGPMAFVGAGASALMAFQMRHFHKNTETSIQSFEVFSDYQFHGAESEFENGLYHYRYNVPTFFSEEDENLGDLMSFHWLNIYCFPEKHQEINAIITRYISAKPREVKQESTVTE